MACGCRSGSVRETAHAPRDAGDGGQESEAATAADAAPPKLGTIERVLFSAKGRLAFVEGAQAFAVVDTRSGVVRRFRGAPEERSMLGFDNRCDVSLRGYMPNVDIHWAATDPGEGVFVRTVGEGINAATFREDLSRATTLAVGTGGSVHGSVVTFTGESDQPWVAPHGSDVKRAMAAPASGSASASEARVVDSSDARPRSVAVGYRERSLADGGTEASLELDDLARPAAASRFFPSAAGALEAGATWVSLDRHLLVTVLETTDDDGRRQSHLCAHDLAAAANDAPACVRFAMPSPFFRMLVNDDGTRIAFTERIVGKPLPRKNSEDYERDASRDVCKLHVLDRRTRKDVSWVSKCATTTEHPLRFEGDVLVTDAADIERCHRSVLRRYDASTGALRSSTPGPPASDDVDDKLHAAMSTTMAKQGGGPMPFVLKQQLWPQTYGHDELVTWSEGTEVLARRGADLVLCKKRGGSCGAPLAQVAEGAVGGAAPDGSVLGAASGGRFVAVDARSGAKLVDVVLEGVGR